MKKISLILITLFSALAVMGVTGGRLAYAGPADDVCEGLNSTQNTNDTSCSEPTGSGSVNNAIGVAVTLFSWVVGVAAVVVMIFGGFRYVTSGGDSNKVSSAKSTILYAIIGLIVVALAQVIVRFTLHRATNQASSVDRTAEQCRPLPGTNAC